MTNYLVCLVYRTDQAHDLKTEKFHLTNAAYGSQGIPEVLPWKRTELFEMKTVCHVPRK